MDIVILCGGNGTRLFPLSRDETPKQFLNLVSNESSMFQMTLNRIKKIKEVGHVYIICNEKHISLVKEQTKNFIDYTIITEPVGRNTAPPIAMISHLCKNKTFLVLSSDHIWDDDIFCQCVHDALCIQKEKIVVFGIEPTHPETGYGYLYCNGNELKRFVEKPCIEKATEFLKDGNYLWNSGNFLFHTKYIQKEFQKHCPELYSGAKNVLFHSSYTDHLIQLCPLHFLNLQDISIDYAIMEHQDDCSVIHYRGKWSDIGSFLSLYDISSKDENENVSEHENVVSFQSSHNFIRTTSKKIVCLSDIENLMILETNDVLYIGDLRKSQNVKKIVEKIKKS